MIGGATAKEAGAAVGLLLNDGEAWGDWGCAFGIGGAEDGDDGEADGGGDVHGARIVAEEEVALGEESGKIGDGGFAREIDRGVVHFGGDGGRDGEFAGSAEEDYIGHGAGVRAEGVQGFGETIGGPAFGGTVGSSGADGYACGVGA